MTAPRRPFAAVSVVLLLVAGCGDRAPPPAAVAPPAVAGPAASEPVPPASDATSETVPPNEPAQVVVLEDDAVLRAGSGVVEVDVDLEPAVVLLDVELDVPEAAELDGPPHDRSSELAPETIG